MTQNPSIHLTSPFDGQVGFKDSEFIDAAGRLRVSNPTTVWDSQFEYNAHVLFYDTVVANNGTVSHNAPHSSVDVNVTTDSASAAYIQSFEYLRYQPEKSQKVVMTFVMAAATTNLDQRVGQFDDENGFFLEMTDSTVNMVRRTKTSGSVVNNQTAQASWNLDVMDGSGRSGITLDLTKVQLLVIDYEWLSAGRVRYGFKVGGILHYVHEENSSNILTVPLTTTANLPVRWEATTTGVIAGARTLEAICVSVVSEGGQNFQTGHPFSFARETVTAADNTEENLIAIRAAATLNSVAFHGKIRPKSFNLLVATATCHWRLRYAPTTMTGASWQSPVTHSGVETDIATTAISGGVVIDEGFIGAAQGNRFNAFTKDEFLERLPLTLDADGTQTTALALTIEGVGGTTSVHGALSWEEIR